MFIVLDALLWEQTAADKFGEDAASSLSTVTEGERREEVWTVGAAVRLQL